MGMAARSESSMRPKISYMGAGRMGYTGTVATTAMAHRLIGLESCWYLQSFLTEKSTAILRSHGIWACRSTS